MDGNDRRVAQNVLAYWPLIVVAVGGIVTAITFWNNVNGLIADQKAFKSTVDERRDNNRKELEDIRTRITRLEQWKGDIDGQFQSMADRSRH